MDVSIEVVRLNNMALLANVHNDVFDHDVKREYLEPFLTDPRNLLLVAVVEDSVIGMVSGLLYTHPDKPLQLFLNEIGIANSHRRKGIGKRLISALLDEAKAAGCTEAWVATEEGNEAARMLYLSASGQQDPEKAIVYTWNLKHRVNAA